MVARTSCLGNPARLAASAAALAGLASGARADWIQTVGIGERPALLGGAVTGREGGPFNYREGKAQAIRELAEREDLDLGASYAYSDSESDLPMLRLVGHPVAVNPDKTLARVAREEGWEIMRFERLGLRLRIAAAAAVVSGLALGARAVRA